MISGPIDFDYCAAFNVGEVSIVRAYLELSLKWDIACALIPERVKSVLLVRCGGCKSGIADFVSVHAVLLSFCSEVGYTLFIPPGR